MYVHMCVRNVLVSMYSYCRASSSNPGMYLANSVHICVFDSCRPFIQNVHNEFNEKYSALWKVFTDILLCWQ